MAVEAGTLLPPTAAPLATSGPARCSTTSSDRCVRLARLLASVLLGVGDSRCLRSLVQDDDEERSCSSSSSCPLTLRCQSSSWWQWQLSSAACKTTTSRTMSQGCTRAVAAWWQAGCPAGRARDGVLHGHARALVCSHLIATRRPFARRGGVKCARRGQKAEEGHR